MPELIINPYATKTNPYRGLVRSFTFYRLIEESLDIHIESLPVADRFEAFERLINAANAMQGRVGDFTGINICIHVASSFVLLGSDDDVYHHVADMVEGKFTDVDPSVIITNAALYYILQKMIGRLKNQPDRLEVIDSYIKFSKEKADNGHHSDLNKFIEYLKLKAKQEHTELTQEQIDNEIIAKANTDIEEAIPKFENIIKRFDLMKWMIGETNMGVLGIANWEYEAKRNIWMEKKVDS